MPISNYLRGLREKVGNAPLLLPAVTILIFDKEDRVLLQRSSDDGKWQTLGGTLEPGEHPAHAAVREAKEETGLDVVPERLVGVFTRPPTVYSNGDVCHYVSTVFRCSFSEGEPFVADDESLELKFFARRELPELPQAAILEIEHGYQNHREAWFER